MSKRFNAYGCMLSVALFAAAAVPAMAAAAHDVPFYRANPAARAATVASCQANPGDLANMPDCVNAIAAARAAAVAAL